MNGPIKEDWLEYNSVPGQYQVSGQIPIDPFCNGLVVKNAGNTILLFQGVPLQPGESKSVGGDSSETLRQ